MLQLVLSGFIVAGSVTYAGWKLLPASAKRWAVGQFLRLPVPLPIAVHLGAALKTAGGCAACGGCGAGVRATTADTGCKPMVFYPRKR